MENIGMGYIPISSAAGSDNRLSGCRNLSQVHLFFFFFLFFESPPLCLSPIRSFVFPGPATGIVMRSDAPSQHAASQCSIVRGNPRRPRGPAGLVCTPVTHFWGVTCITAPLRESLCHVYCHVPRYAAWLQTHQTHLQEYWYWECRGEAPRRVQTHSWKTHTHSRDCALRNGGKINPHFPKLCEKNCSTRFCTWVSSLMPACLDLNLPKCNFCTQLFP